MLPSTSKTAGKQLINNAQSLIKTKKAMMVQKMSESSQQFNAEANTQQQKQSTIMTNLILSEMLNKQFMMESASYHQQMIREKINVQQIMRELNGGKALLDPKEMSTDFFLDSLFGRKNKEVDSQKNEPEGEMIDTDPSDLEFRKQDEGDEGDDKFLREDQDTTDLEFDDHWGVERRGDLPQSTDQEDDSDEDGGEMMPVFM